MVYFRCFVGLLVLPAAGVLADDLILGDKAPPLKISKWVKGDPVKLGEGERGGIRVIEFWSTRCPASRASIPLLTSLQKKYAEQGVRVIGVTDEQDAAKRVDWFVKKMGEKMAYTVAIDDGQKSIDAYMGGFGVETIPHVFIVDGEGIVQWHGHPAHELDKTLKEIVAGVYSIENYRNVTMANRMLERYERLVGRRGNKAEAERLGMRIFQAGRNDPGIMNRLAWRILDDARVRYRDLDLAMKAAKAAYEGCEGKDAAIVDTYARAFYENGDVHTALKYQEMAVSLIGDNHELRPGLIRWLGKYRKEVGPK